MENPTYSSWSDLGEWPALHSVNPAERYASSIEFGDKYPKQPFKWPHGCRGAANAWLVLLGPSPGKKGPRETSRGDRAWDCSPTIGLEQQEIQFSDGKQRNPRFAKIAHAGFGTHGNDEMPKRLTALMNLDGKNAPDASQIESSDLCRGCQTVYDLLVQAKPRVVIVLSFAAWNPFSNFLKSKGAASFASPPAFPNGRSLYAVTLKLAPEIPFSTLFVKSRQHPSMPFFKIGVDDEAIRRTVDSFLTKVETR